MVVVITMLVDLLDQTQVDIYLLNGTENIDHCRLPSLPHPSKPEQTNLLEVLHFLTMRKDVMFSSSNRDPEFIACITYWLLVVGLQHVINQPR